MKNTRQVKDTRGMERDRERSRDLERSRGYEPDGAVELADYWGDKMERILDSGHVPHPNIVNNAYQYRKAVAAGAGAGAGTGRY